MPYVNLCDFSALRIHIFLECMGRKSLLKIDLLGNENLFSVLFHFSLDPEWGSGLGQATQTED